jgi:hypothetical protein
MNRMSKIRAKSDREAWFHANAVLMGAVWKGRGCCGQEINHRSEKLGCVQACWCRSAECSLKGQGSMSTGTVRD